MAVEEANLLELAAGGVDLDAGDVDDAETRGVVGLVSETIDDLKKELFLLVGGFMGE